jgi:hypothetical protein
MLVFLNSGVAMAVEEPEFKVESKTDTYEIRKYSEILVAETQVNSSFEESGNIAFRILADYIFGNNKLKSKIDMTSPVTMQPRSEKIEMTAPVGQVKNAAGFLIQFTMPKKFTLETLPEPNDVRVHLRKIPARRVAVYRYSGRWTEERYQEKLKEFLSALKNDHLQIVGEPVFSRFDPPFMPWFLRRNEIWMEVI